MREGGEQGTRRGKGERVWAVNQAAPRRDFVPQKPPPSLAGAQQSLPGKRDVGPAPRRRCSPLAGAPQRLSQRKVSCLGAALLAAAGLGRGTE